MFSPASLDGYEDLAARYGTPLYVYDGNVIEQQYKRLTHAFAQVPKLGIHYAAKALPNIHILARMKALGAGLDAVSIEEVELGLHAGFLPQQILYTPNCASFAELERAIELGVQVTLDSLPIVEMFAERYDAQIPICLRINPHIMAGGHRKISVGHIDSKFGISVHQMPELLRLVSERSLHIAGLHMHTGSDILDADVFLQGAEILFEHARAFPDLKFLDFGSGFKVAYQDGGVETDIEALGEKLSHRFVAFCKSYGRALELIFEPGKFLVSAAGVLLVHVNVVKITPATVFVGVDSGMNHLLRPMFYDAYHHIENLTHPEGKKRIYNVVGYICETDTFAGNRPLPEVRVGDLLAIRNAGAYGMSMSSNYNSRLRPAEVLIQDGAPRLIRRRETLDDLLRTQLFG